MFLRMFPRLSVLLDATVTPNVMFCLAKRSVDMSVLAVRHRMTGQLQLPMFCPAKMIWNTLIKCGFSNCPETQINWSPSPEFEALGEPH